VQNGAGNLERKRQSGNLGENSKIILPHDLMTIDSVLIDNWIH
jgi:hypothetical protein